MRTLAEVRADAEKEHVRRVLEQCLNNQIRAAELLSERQNARRSARQPATQRDLGWTTNPTENIPFVRETRRYPAVLTAPELGQLFETAAKTSRGWKRARNLAFLAVLSQVALRVHESVGLDVGQVDLASRTLLAVNGKGGTVDDLPLNARAAALLAAWLGERPAMEGEFALFVSQRGTRLTPTWIPRNSYSSPPRPRPADSETRWPSAVGVDAGVSRS